jgi:integrase
MGVNIRQKPTGSGVWWVFINHRGSRKSKKIGKDKKLAKQYQKKLEAKILLNDLDMDTFNRTCPLFKPYAKQWLALPHKRKDNTQRGYVRTLEMHIYLVLGKMELKNIKRRDLKSLFDNLAINGMATSNFQNIKAPLNHIFNQAVLDDWIDHNPLVGLTFSNKRNIDIKPLTEEEAFVLLDEVKEYRDGLFYPHILLLLSTGLRVSELCGLQWNDFDFDDRTLTVQRQVHHGMEGKTKNGKTRIVDMPLLLTETLKNLKHEKQKEALKRGIPFCDWVFSFNGRDPMTPRPIKTTLDACLKKAGLPHMRIHDLRHSYATIRLMKGDNIGDVSYQMGHSSIKITFDTYTHWIPGKFKSQVDDLFLQPNATQAHSSKASNEKSL